MTRRTFVAAALAAPALASKNRIGRSRISAITDEIGRTPAEASAFARQYGLDWIEVRAIPGGRKYYSTLTEAEARAAAAEFTAAGLKVSFLNSAMLKFGLPGTDPVRRRPEAEDARARRLAQEQTMFDRRLDDLNAAIRAAHVLGVRKIRIFAFHRVAEPEALYQRIADIVGEMTKVAERERVELLLENEGSCNIASSAELAAFLKMVPSRALGINWDPLNGSALKETPFPDGYRLLPIKRVGNVQIKGRSLLEGPQRMDWAAIFRALEKDGYKGQVGLETHIFGDQQIAASHASMREILRIVEPS